MTALLDRFGKLVLAMEAVGDPMDQLRQHVILLGSHSVNYKAIVTVIENMTGLSLDEVKEKLLKKYEKMQHYEPAEGAFNAPHHINRAGCFNNNKTRPHQQHHEGDWLWRCANGKTVTLANVSHISGLDRRLLSVPKLTDRGFVTQFKSKSCNILRNSEVVVYATRVNNSFILQGHYEHAMIVEFNDEHGKWELWHARTGHQVIKLTRTCLCDH